MGARLYVGNLNYRTTEAGLRSAIEARGRSVVGVAIASDPETGRSRGFALVELSVDGGLQAAIDELNGLHVDGRPLRVRRAGDTAAETARRTMDFETARGTTRAPRGSPRRPRTAS